MLECLGFPVINVNVNPYDKDEYERNVKKYGEYYEYGPKKSIEEE